MLLKYTIHDIFIIMQPDATYLNDKLQYAYKIESFYTSIPSAQKLTNPSGLYQRTREQLVSWSLVAEWALVEEYNDDNEIGEIQTTVFTSLQARLWIMAVPQICSSSDVERSECTATFVVTRILLILWFWCCHSEMYINHSELLRFSNKFAI